MTSMSADPEYSLEMSLTSTFDQSGFQYAITESVNLTVFNLADITGRKKWNLGLLEVSLGINKETDTFAVNAQLGTRGINMSTGGWI